MVSGGYFRDHSAVARVQIDLAVHTVGQQAPIRVIQRHARFVAAGFDPEYTHKRRIIPQRACGPRHFSLHYPGLVDIMGGHLPALVPGLFVSTALKSRA
jgi:hypothetical protein